MNKIYKTAKLICLALLLGVGQLNAALSGVYTINNASSTSGTNFASFGAFVSALTSQGVSGPVTVNVSNGPYNEQINITSVSGVSATNTITINGNNCLLTYNSSSSNQAWTFGIGGGDFIYVNNLNVFATGSSYAYALHLFNGADNNSFTNCTFSVQIGTYYNDWIIPVTVSGGAYHYQSGVSGNNNTWTGCTLAGGYYSAYVLGSYSGPFATGNKMLNCNINDFDFYGLYFDSNRNLTIAGNHVARMGHPSPTDCYGAIYINNTWGAVIDGNEIHDLFFQSPSTYAWVYCIQVGGYSSMPLGSLTRNIVRNNIIRDINFDGYLYGIYSYDGRTDFFHNTISFDQTGSSGYDTYGIELDNYDTGFEDNVWNNIITITRGGYGYEYGYLMYLYAGANSVDYNDVYVNSANGNNYTGYHSNYGSFTSFNSWKTGTNFDTHGTGANPTYSNLASGNLKPTNLSIDNLGTPKNTFVDYYSNLRDQVHPDMGAIEFNRPNCSGTPSITGIVSPTYAICPGELVNLGLTNYLAQDGLTYSWVTSTVSNVGPFTNTISTTFTASASNVTTSTWVQVLVTCTLSNGSISPVAEVSIAPVTTNTAPYFEDFEGIGKNDRLPNCSWSAPGIGNTAHTYNSAQSGNRLPRSGTSFATLENTQATNYYYTNQIYMSTGITYSASVWYMTDFSGSANWSDLSLLIGSTQTTVGLTSIASTNGPAISPVYKQLSSTFTVPATGYYYVAIKGSATTGGAPYMVLDDLSITIPCTPTYNTPTVTISLPSATVCANTLVNMAATGADTYKWNTGATTPGAQVTPIVTSLYSVIGTNTLSGCSSTVTQLIVVKQAPSVSISQSPLVPCLNQPVILAASGAGTYAWNNGQTTSIITVTPTGNTSFTVVGTNSLNCSGSAVAILQPQAGPTINVTGPQTMCKGEVATLQGAGAVDYEWYSSAGYLHANPITVSPLPGLMTYTVVGKDQYGCPSTQIVNIQVELCSGIASNGSITGLKVYPNPAQQQVNIENASVELTSIVVTDVAGRKVYNGNVSGHNHVVDLTNMAAGVYYINVATADKQVATVKIVKQ